jgi:hypothetical protein
MSSSRKRRVFKVETVGDCYVAVTGLPDPMKDHAVVLARFAKDCLIRLRSLTHALEVTLGPDTSELELRVGLHSGPVTAGVLRGERSRFQLFGDAMNTASRMESTSQRGKIQLSQETADLLVVAGKGSWILPRKDVVIAKGKGAMRTYWLNVATPKSSKGESTESVSDGCLFQEIPGFAHPCMIDAKHSRLIRWTVDVLVSLLQKIASHRLPTVNTVPLAASHRKSKCITVLEEVKEIIRLPNFRDTDQHREAERIVLPGIVQSELHKYVPWASKQRARASHTNFACVF